MDKNLKSVIDFIQQIPNIPAEQKDSVLKSLKTVDKELQILSFKLDRTEKVKRTTAILLEETIEELEQKRKAVEEALTELKATQNQLIQQEKLASLGQLTAGIAHEIKNPLNFVNNFSDLSLELVDEIREEVLSKKAKVKSEKESERSKVKGELSPLEGGKDPSADGDQGDDPSSKPKVNPSTSNTPLNPLSRGESEGGAEARGVFYGEAGLSPDTNLILEILDDIEANLKTIHKHGSRADNIVKSMLQHSRGGDGVMEPTPLNPLIKEYVNLAFHGMRAGDDPINVDIDLKLDENVGDVPLVAEDFSRVILNLVNNAFDALREKATVKREESPLEGSGDPESFREKRGVSSVEDYHPKLTVRTKSNSNTITIEFEDNGPGIPDEIKDKILQPFFTTKKGTQGTGLGLSITNDIIKSHGGEMNVASGKLGSTFSIELKHV